MSNYKKILFIKTAWSEFYTGGRVLGNHKHLKEHENVGHECFNFKPYKGEYYCYIPPIAGSCPQLETEEAKNWLVIVTARINGTGPLVVVGYYKDAQIYSSYKKRPEYRDKNSIFETDDDGDFFTYNVKSSTGTLLPLSERKKYIIPPNLSKHIQSASIAYIRGPKSTPEKWRTEFEKIALDVIDSKQDNLDKKFPKIDVDTKKIIENNAIRHIIQFYEKKHYKIVDRQKDNCGYDLLAINKDGNELHIEVKGSASNSYHFFLTYNEMNCMNEDPKWRLAIVKNALQPTPAIKVLNKKTCSVYFDIKPIEWEGTEI